MKKILMIVAVLAFVAGTATASYACGPSVWITNSELPPAEGPPDQYSCAPGMYAPYVFYIWVCPDPLLGFSGIEFQLDGKGGGGFQYALMGGPSVMEIGTPFDLTKNGWVTIGLTPSYGWTMFCTFGMNPITSTAARQISMIPSWGGKLELMSADGLSLYKFERGNTFGVNDTSVVPTVESSWGAVKSMYR